MAAKAKIDERKMMRLAIEVMRQSVPEPRGDGKVGPKVGAVLVKPDGTVETACRGELRHGDHAEFTLLERKNRGNKLDGSILFATLEPCAPGARRDPKIDCAERIRLARIKKVWIGIQDPDPKVARKAIQHLENSGIEVAMFDRALQEIIEQENAEFLKQANERAAAAKKPPAKIVLSPLENKFDLAELHDFSNDALEFYRDRAKIKAAVGTSEFNRLLLQQGLLKKDKDQLIPTGFGMLLFSKKPRNVLRQAGLLASITYPNGEKERKEFDEPAVLIPGLVEKWLKDKLPNVFDRSQMHRQERPALPFEMVREAIVNALIHRDYDIEGGKCQLTVDANTIIVRSPGGPVPPITLEQMQTFSVPILSRNPSMHFVFARMGMAEEQGLGLNSLRDGARQQHLPLPRFTWVDPYLVLTLYRSREALVHSIPAEVLESLSNSEQQGWQWLAEKGKARSSQYAQAQGVDARTARRHLTHFVSAGLARKSGSGPQQEYEVSW